MASGKCATIKSLDLDSSDNITEDVLGKFLERFVSRDDFYLTEENVIFCLRYGAQLEGLALSGMGHVTDTLWNAYLPKLVNAKILVNCCALNVKWK